MHRSCPCRPAKAQSFRPPHPRPDRLWRRSAPARRTRSIHLPERRHPCRRWDLIHRQGPRLEPAPHIRGAGGQSGKVPQAKPKAPFVPPCCRLSTTEDSTGCAVEGSEERIRRRVPSTARSEEHTTELQSLLRISYAVYCLKQKP